MSMSDKRRCHRYDIELPVSFKLSHQQKHISVATTINISAKGICMASKEKFLRGQKFPMQVKLPSGERLVIHVEVIWVKEVLVCNTLEFQAGIKIADGGLKADEAKFVKFCADIMLDEYKARKDRNQIDDIVLE